MYNVTIRAVSEMASAVWRRMELLLYRFRVNFQRPVGIAKSSPRDTAQREIAETRLIIIGL